MLILALCSKQYHAKVQPYSALSRGGAANFECCVSKQQPTNPTHYTFKLLKSYI